MTISPDSEIARCVSNARRALPKEGARDVTPDSEIARCVSNAWKANPQEGGE